jgi:transcriptional regulator with XRE-family HTH domain
MTTLSEILRLTMQDKGITSGELARISGVGERTVQRVMSGKKDAHADTLRKLCDNLTVWMGKS